MSCWSEKKIWIIVALLLSLTAKRIYAEKNLIPGLVIMATGDTLKGYIDYKNWDLNPTTIDFTIVKSQPTFQIPVLKTRAFYVEGEVYISAVVTVDKTTNHLNSLHNNDRIQLRTDTVFLRTIVAGAKSLFQYKDKNGKEHFFIKKGNGLELLLFKKYYKTVNLQKVLVTDRTYLIQLKEYLSNCDPSLLKFWKVSYSRTALRDLLYRYYAHCSANSIPFVTTKDSNYHFFGVVLGVSNTSIDFNSYSGLHTLTSTRFSNSKRPAFGLFYNAQLSRNQGKWSLYNELHYNAYRSSGIVTDSVNPDWYFRYTSTLGYHYLNLTNLVCYSLPVGNFSVRLGAGISNGIWFKEENIRRIDKKFFFNENQTYDRALQDTRRYEQSYVFSGAVHFQKYHLEFRHQKGNGVSVYSLLNSGVKRNYFLVGYTF